MLEIEASSFNVPVEPVPSRFSIQKRKIPGKRPLGRDDQAAQYQG
jgi:hypothetical protein